MSATLPVSVGSEWHRWDPHLHAPGTLLSDQFGGDWDTYLQRLESSSPPVQALGITDYFCLRDRLPTLKKDLEALRTQVDKDRMRLASLLPKGKAERAKRLVELENACTRAEGKIERLTKKRRLLDDLAGDIIRFRNHTEPARIADLRRRFVGLELTSAEWESFKLGFSGDVDRLIERNRGLLEKAVAIATDGDPVAPFDARSMDLDQWPLRELRAARDAAKREVGIDAEHEQQYAQLQRAIAKQETSAERLTADIASAEGAEDRRRQLIDARRSTYAEVFGTFVREEEVLQQL